MLAAVGTKSMILGKENSSYDAGLKGATTNSNSSEIMLRKYESRDCHSLFVHSGFLRQPRLNRESVCQSLVVSRG